MASVSNGIIFRVPRHDNFTVMSNIHLSDLNLSWKARGLLSTMLSFPPGWDFTLEGLATRAKDSLSSTRNGVLELEENGYLHRIQQRKPDGTWAKMEYQVYEDPTQNPHLKNRGSENNADAYFHPVCDFPIPDNPISDYPPSEKPISENRMQLNTHTSKYSSDQSLNQSISQSEASSTVKKSDDGLMDRAAELPKGFLDTLTEIGYDCEGDSRYVDEESAKYWLTAAHPDEEFLPQPLDNNLLKSCRIPYSFSASKTVMERTLRIIACFHHYQSPLDPSDPMIGVISALASMATARIEAKYNKQTVTAQQVIDKINERIAEDGCLIDWLSSFLDSWKVVLAERRDSIKHLSAYMKTCLWKWLEDSDAETFGDVIIL